MWFASWGKGKQSFGIIPVSSSLSRLLTVKDGSRTCYLFVEDVIVKYAARIFRPLKIQNATLARVTRNADIGLTDFAIEDDHDYSDFLQEQLESASAFSLSAWSFPTTTRRSGNFSWKSWS